MFVPIQSQASPAAMELALRITNVIREFQEGRTDVKSRDIRRALRMAELSTGAGPARAMAISAILGMTATVLGLVLIISKGKESPGPTPATLPLILMMVVLGVFVMLLVVRSRR
jgi:hypothetical protein